jgi:transposase
LVEQYGLIGVEDVDWRNIGRRETADGKSNDIAMLTARMRNLAAPGAFLMELSRAAVSSGSRINRHAGTSTWECNACASDGVTTVIAPADRSELIHSCPQCSSSWDQDVNAARNLRAAALASAPVLAPALPPLAGSKRTKFKVLSRAGAENEGAGKGI